jgi:hypothetical protein
MLRTIKTTQPKSRYRNCISVLVCGNDVRTEQLTESIATVADGVLQGMLCKLHTQTIVGFAFHGGIIRSKETTP